MTVPEMPPSAPNRSPKALSAALITSETRSRNAIVPTMPSDNKRFPKKLLMPPRRGSGFTSHTLG